jgi:hypothetical protein
MDTITIASIVEGDGEVQALPTLLRRIAYEQELWNGQFPRPIRVPRSKIVVPAQLTRYVQIAAEMVPGPGGVLVLLDADKDCPAELGPLLQEAAQKARPEMRVRVVVAHCEFENWLLAAASSLAGQKGLAAELDLPRQPESVRDAKGWLTKNMTTGHSYKPVVDQAGFVEIFDMDAARAVSDSFDKLRREVDYLLGRADQHG